MKTLAVLLCGFALLIASAHAGDFLPSWNNTGPKKAIVAFVALVF